MITRIYQYLIRKLSSGEKYARSLGVTLGNECDLAKDITWGSEPYLITIGNHVQITSGVRFFTHGASWVFRRQIPTFDCFGKILIKDNVYIGNCALILPGVTIGNNVVIGAGTIVTKSIPDNSIVVGNPGRVINNIQNLYDRMMKYNIGTKGCIPSRKKELLLNLDDSLFMKK